MASERAAPWQEGWREYNDCVLNRSVGCPHLPIKLYEDSGMHVVRHVRDAYDRHLREAREEDTKLIERLLNALSAADFALTAGANFALKRVARESALVKMNEAIAAAERRLKEKP